LNLFDNGISLKRPDARKLTELFDQCMKKLRDTGQLDAIPSGYGLTDRKK